MAESAGRRPPAIIVRRPRRGESHGPAHGGAWKVAYADFVTAMMAFFLVMWLANQNEEVKRAVGGYFRDPLGMLEVAGSDAQEGADGVLDAGSAPMAGQASLLELPLQRGRGSEGDDSGARERRAALERAAAELRRRLEALPGYAQIAHLIELSQTPEGLRIELMESDRGTFFELGARELTGIGREVLTVVGATLAGSPGGVVVEGHTDSLTYSTLTYTNWDLSTDRANAARRLLETTGLAPGRIEEIRGYADQRPRYPERPEDPRNRRISILLRGEPPPAAQPAGRAQARR
ncbi:MAG TPA: flagellar motor protein MotB [Myxococcota bacterium]